jgi:hypothetical protein
VVVEALAAGAVAGQGGWDHGTTQTASAPVTTPGRERSS